MAKISAAEALTALPGEEWWRQFEHGMGEKADEVAWLRFPSDAERVEEFEEGVAFGPHSEARWRRRLGGWHLVLIDDAGTGLEDADASQELEEAGVTEVLLWGERGEEGELWESRIPAALPYGDIEGESERLAVECKQYWMTGENGEPLRMSRMVRVKAPRGEEGQ